FRSPRPRTPRGRGAARYRIGGHAPVLPAVRPRPPQRGRFAAAGARPDELRGAHVVQLLGLRARTGLAAADHLQPYGGRHLVTQETRVFAGIDPPRAAELRAGLQRSLPPDADWRPTPHASFSVRAEGVVVTCYHSGKLVVQGSGLDAFLARHLPDLATAEPAAPDPLPMAGVTLGSDEAGKGDYFGPLVVAAVCVAPEQEARLRAAGITDSKKLRDERAATLAGLLEREVDHEYV